MRYRLAPIGLAALVLTGCVTTPATGSRVWYDQRVAEIEAAYENGELTQESYLTLKNQTDQTRVEYQNALRERRYYYPGPYFSPFFFHHRYYHHHHHHRRH